MSVRKYLVHTVLICQDCKWESQDYLKAQKLAREHVRKTGHTVSGDLGYCVMYLPRAKKDKP